MWVRIMEKLEVAGGGKTSCENNGITVTDHFADVSKMIKSGKGGNQWRSLKGTKVIYRNGMETKIEI